jgi:replicative DNA helicase
VSYLVRDFDHAPVEQGVVGACLLDAIRLDSVLSRLSPADFQETVHIHIMDVLSSLRAEGRTPSSESVVLHLGDTEIVAGLSLRGYLGKLKDAAVASAFGSWQDAVELIRDQAQRRRLSEIGNEVATASISSPENVASIAEKAVSALDDVLAAQRAGKVQRYDLGAAARSALALLDREEVRNPTWGHEDLDRMTGGLPRGQTTVLAGRPAMGKSTVGLMTVRRAAAKGLNCVLFSLEMTAEQIGSRLMADAAYIASSPIAYEDIEAKRIDDRARSRLEKAADDIAKLPVIVEEQRGLTSSELCARARKHHARLAREGKRLDILVVDHIGLLRPSSRYAGNREREMAEISDALATLAKDLDIAVLALCQLNRGVEGRESKRPSLADLRASGAIEEDASLVCFVYRPAYYLATTSFDNPDVEAERVMRLEASRNDIEFIVAKNRNGRCGTVEAFCDIGANAIRSKNFGSR